MRVIFLLLVHYFCFISSQPFCNSTYTLLWNEITSVSKAITTLQVVGNPLLNPETSPVADKIFALLSQLNTNLIRYVPWFPYPKVGVAELNPPKGGATSWDFTDIEPQFRRFMNATYGFGRTVIPNFSTQPTWMYSTNDWSYPVDPNKVDWNYPRGNAYSNTTENLVGYYTRLISWMVLGSFKDEFGVTHTNNGERYQLTHWEVFNEPEGCHGLTYQTYTQQYDAIVKGVRAVVDPQKNIKFVGLALSGRETDWISYFLNPANHDPAALPIEYISFHFYASCDERTNANSYKQFFSAADGFIAEAQNIMNIKNSISPNTKIDLDELGVILPQDTDNNAPPFPLVYWNAAAAFYAYLFANLAPMGYDVLGESQLAGTPPIPQWDIMDAQFSGVSMVNWTTGEGTARFWVLKLLIDTFQPGDKFVKSNSSQEMFCAELDTSIGTVSLSCTDPTAHINNIFFAAYGLPTGTCDNYKHNPACDATNVTDYVRLHCIGKNNCSILTYPTFGDPCFDKVKKFVIQATCSGNQGGSGFPSSNPVFILGAIDAKIPTSRKILIINKDNIPVCATIPKVTGGTIYMLDEYSGFGPAKKEFVASDVIGLQPFAVAVIILN